MIAYVIEDDWQVYAGKTAADNDLLSLKVAAANDHWFHVRGMPGSHVILVHESDREPDRKVLDCAASIAAYHSKSRNAGKVSVACCKAQHVKKPRGAKAGTVELKKERLLKVRPWDGVLAST